MFDNSAIILGFTGSIGSGCSYISKEISQVTGNKYKYFKLSNVIRELLKEEGNQSPTVSELQQKGNLLRKEYGRNALVVNLILGLQKIEIETFKNIIIDGIKNDGEVEYLRQFPNFYLFSVQADRENRKVRVVGPSKPFSDDEAFYAADKKDEVEDDNDGQQVKKCSDSSDIIIVNETNITETATNKKRDFVSEIIRKYIDLIENNVIGKPSPQTSPSVNELCMTLAYAMSKKSSCLKRKVGAVIIDSDNHPNSDVVEEKAPKVPNVIASGYNEVPEGAFKCIFNQEYQKCYRDHLQEVHAEKMKFCPTCGVALSISITCPKCEHTHNKFVKTCEECRSEIKAKYICSNCKINVFEEHLPGSKNTPGKLLDLCRALHGEEMAILQLSKRGGKGFGDLVMFVTTQPCNLCANKIATSGIKKVVYAEPYNMKEAAQILKSGGVELERFQGVKSSAYFKLYN